MNDDKKLGENEGPNGGTVFKLLILLSTLNLLTSCAGMFPGRSFIDEMDRESDGLWVPGEDFPVTAGDSGEAFRPMDEIARRTPASAYELERMQADRSIQQELKRKVNALDEMQYAQFVRDRDALQSPSEQIYYLDLTPRERVQYVALKRGNPNQTNTDRPYAYLGNYRADNDQTLRTYFMSRYEDKALNLGMSKQEVMDVWGEPQNVDFAGDPRLQNERWSFYEKGKVHQVFFESGKVQGWAID